MAETYNPTGTVQITPQAGPPGLGVQVTVSVPQNLDGFNNDNFEQALKQLAQWAQWLSDHAVAHDVVGQTVSVSINFVRIGRTGTALTVANLTYAGWGTGAVANLSGTDNQWRVEITAGTGASSNPTWSFSFIDGPHLADRIWNSYQKAPDGSYSVRFHNDAPGWVATTTGVSTTFAGTPANGSNRVWGGWTL